MLALGLIGMTLSGFDVPVFGREFQLHAMIAFALLTIVGAQVVALAVSARAFAVYVLGEREDRMLGWGLRHLRLERALLLGGLVLLAGLIIGGVVVATWIDRGFGQLNEEKLLVFASVLVIVGVQAVFSAFFLSIIGLAREEPPTWPAHGPAER